MTKFMGGLAGHPSLAKVFDYAEKLCSKLPETDRLKLRGVFQELLKPQTCREKYCQGSPDCKLCERDDEEDEIEVPAGPLADVKASFNKTAGVLLDLLFQLVTGQYLSDCQQLATEPAGLLKALQAAEEKAASEDGDEGKLRKATDKEREGLSKFVSKVKETFKDRKHYSVKYILFGQAPNGKKTGGVLKDGIRLYPIWTNPPDKIANIKVNSFIEGLVKGLVAKWEKAMFERLVMIMSTDDTFKSQLGILDYVDAIRIESIEDVSDTSAKDMNIREERLRESAGHFSIYHRYIETEVDTDYYTVKEAIENKSYKENECGINSLNEHYEGTELMREKRGKLAKTVSREKVLELIKMSDDECIEKGGNNKSDGECLSAF